MSTREEMIAHGRTEAEVAAELGADSLAYLSLEGVYEAIEGTRETHCDACFSGDYPLAGTAAAQAKDAFEIALPLARA
jgi:amidophosphoribosyltransferase